MTDHGQDPHPATDDGRDDELARRLRDAYGVEPAPETRRDHLTTIHAAVDAARPAWAWRHRLALLVAAATVASPVGLAVAAEGAVPGDLLYPVKRAAEAVVGIVDRDVRATHRVDELARLLDRDAEPDDLEPAVTDAQLAVAREGDDALRRRLVALTIEASRRADAILLDALPQIDDLPTAVPDVPALPPTDRSPTVAPTEDGRDDPRDRPRDEPTATRSPGPVVAEPQPEPTRTARDEPPPDDVRTERHRALDAGVVTLRVSASRGIQLAAVDPAVGWDWRADRSEEPRRVVVAFFDGHRRVILEATYSPDRGVVVRVQEHEPEPTRDGTQPTGDRTPTRDGG